MRLFFAYSGSMLTGGNRRHEGSSLIMNITFLLPQRGTKPTGGHRVVYEHANGLAARGHRVTVVHVSGLAYRFQPLKSVRRHLVGYAKHGLRGDWKPDAWFAVDPRVRLAWVPALRAIFVPDADACIATWWQTAERLAHFPRSRGRKFYLIQHLETWGGPAERVMATWRMPLEKIVIARWLEGIARDMGERARYVPNGLNFAGFGIDTPVAEREPGSVAMLYHPAEWKGSADGLQALERVRRHRPGLHAELFGVQPRPNALPAWIDYHCNPAQAEIRRLYNRSAIFLAPSHSEGWGLTASEAMMCGAAVVATDIGGHREFCVDGETALLVPARSPERLAASIERLIADQTLRRILAANAHAHVQQFTWERATGELERVLSDGSANMDAEPA